MVAMLVGLAVGVFQPTPPAPAVATTVVSLTFDDGHWSHYKNAHPILQAHDMRGTFYLNTGRMVETCPEGQFCWRMTWPQAREMYAEGQEMSGHTLNHTDLTTLTTEKAKVEVCNDRDNLVTNGFRPTISFAYPYAAYNTSAQQIVRECGYTSGRTAGGFPSGVYAETIPPQDPYAVRTPVTDRSLAQLQAAVTNAENNGGGWVPIVFHEVCDCSDASLSVTLKTFTAFLDWLQPRSANGTVVRTVGDVMSGAAPAESAPTTTASCNDAACSIGWYRTSPVMVGLSATDPDADHEATYYTTDGTDPVTSASRQTYTAPFTIAETATVKFYSTDTAGNVESTKSQFIQIDAAAPAVSVTNPADGATIQRGAKVKITVRATDARTGGGAASGVAKVASYVDGTVLSTDTAAPFEWVWNTRKLALGQHTIKAVATDVAGNGTTSTTITVTLVR
jgi:peptidoglycan/xylan/chitin deacetylase (PgdA/CDA1 family)